MLLVTAFCSMWSWLRRKHVSEQLQLRLYNAFVRPVLLYNAGESGVMGLETENLDAFHWKQLRSFIQIYWTQKISNVKSCEWCHCRQISTDVMDMRWCLFGHILHLDEEAPANKVMSAYFQMDGLHGYRGRSRTSLPVPSTPTCSRTACD